MIYVAGPGHGGPAMVANTYLEGTYSEVYPERARATPTACASCSGSSRFPAAFRATSPPETPGSIHEGGELGYALSHAFGAAFDNPGPDRRLRRRRRRGRDRAAGRRLAFEQVPQPGARRRGAADPASERLQDRQPDGAGAHSARRTARRCSSATATSRYFVEGDEPDAMHAAMAATLDAAFDRDPRDPAGRARRRGSTANARAGR